MLEISTSLSVINVFRITVRSPKIHPHPHFLAHFQRSQTLTLNQRNISRSPLTLHVNLPTMNLLLEHGHQP